jgi:ABC-type histidine transport system ATPase subunit
VIVRFVDIGEIVVICGPSGSGKSTLIRCINFLEKFQEGSVTVNGTVLSEKLIQRINVDLPLPEGPQITTISPFLISRLMFLSA